MAKFCCTDTEVAVRAVTRGRQGCATIAEVAAAALEVLALYHLPSAFIMNFQSTTLWSRLSSVSLLSVL